MWTGPISVSVYVTQIELDTTTIYINYMRHCCSEVRNQVSFHFISPNGELDDLNGQLMNEAKNKTFAILQSSRSWALYLKGSIDLNAKSPFKMLGEKMTN